MPPSIEAEGLWKQYRYGTIGYGTLRQDFQSWWARIRKREDPNAPTHPRPRTPRAGETLDRFWALEDVSFSVDSGDVVGVIGRNGAGKSTLLKVLSRVTSPTRGEVRLRGRVASLLEVGTGFHPDLTGQENVYLNGSIHGMTRAEIRGKYDEIVEFAGLGPFMATPVKRYSTGMYMRLAFSVAAHLSSEILVVDEVLAVGDAEFQKKCLGKLGGISQEGRTVLFVSHNMNAIEELCSSAIWLEGGRVLERGAPPSGVVERYIRSLGSATVSRADSGLRPNPWAELLAFELVDENGQEVRGAVRNNAKTVIRIRVEVKRPDPGLNFGYALFAAGGQLLYWSLAADASESERPQLEKGVQSLVSELPRRLLNEGIYEAHLWAGIHAVEWLSQPMHGSPFVRFEIRGGLSDSEFWREARPGLLAPLLAWQMQDGLRADADRVRE